MAEMMLPSLADLYSKAQTIKTNQQTIASNALTARNNELKRYGTLATIGLSQFGKPEDYADDASRNAAWGSMLSTVRTIAPDVQMDNIPTTYSPEALRLVQGIANFSKAGDTQDTIQSTYVNDKGERVQVYRSGKEVVSGRSYVQPVYDAKLGVYFDPITRRLYDADMNLTDQVLPGGAPAAPAPATLPTGQAPAQLPGNVTSVVPNAPTPAAGGGVFTQAQQRSATLDANAAAAAEAARTEARIRAEAELAGVQADTRRRVEGAAAEGKGAAEGRQKSIDEAIQAAKDAAPGIPAMYRALDLLDEVKTGGVGSTAWNAVQGFLGTQSADAGELSYLFGKATLAQLKPIFGAAFTAAEGERLERIEASFGRNPEVNRRLLKNAIDTVEGAVKRGIRAAKQSGDDFTANELQLALDARLGGNNPPPVDENGWVLEVDRQGNRAYVNPNNRQQYREVR